MGDVLKQKTAVIAGAGPAGLTAALELLRQGDVCPVVCEASEHIGGISRTARHNGNRIDIGGHRFFSKSETVMRWWSEIMPMQGAPSADDILLGREPQLTPDGPDPEVDDCVMLRRNRISSIHYLNKFFDYPISLKWQTLANIGFWRTMKAGTGYMLSSLNAKPETSLENFFINRFGAPLYRMFFEDYTTKVWGIHPSNLGADWGAQRVKGLSVTAILKDMFRKKLSRKSADGADVETSLIESFIYPKYGPGQLWETVAARVCAEGGEILMQNPVRRINVKDGKVVSVLTETHDGFINEIPCDWFISSMPVSELISILSGIEIPPEVKEIAYALRYRDFITVGLLLDELEIHNSTSIPTYRNRIPDTWIYVQDRNVRLGRIQVFNNWSPYMLADFKGKVWIGLEYFCTEGDDLWQMDEKAMIDFAISEVEKIGLVNPAKVRDAVRIKVKKAYPVYAGAYYRFDEVRRFLDSIPNLFCIGRNGQHRYNNMDHSMLTAMEAVKAIYSGAEDKTAVWQVNTETDYHESKQ